MIAKPFRMPVQLVARPDQDFRGYAGQILAGSIRVGEPITAWPSGGTARVKRIVTWDGDLQMAHAPMSVTLVLDDEIDISRGDTITAQGTGLNSGLMAQGGTEPHVGRHFEADVVWMDERPLDPARLYMLKHTTRTVTVEANRPLALNQIETVTLTTSRPIVFDRYRDIRATGSFILIDPATNFTAGAGMIIDAIRDRPRLRVPAERRGAPGQDRAIGVHARGGSGRDAARNRGAVEVIDVAELVANTLADAKTPCVTSSFQAEDVVLVHFVREVDARDAGPVPRDVPSLPADADLSRRHRREVEPEPDQPEGARAVRSASGRRAPTTAARATRSGRCSARSKGTTPGSPGCGATSRRHAPTFSTSSRLR